MKQSKYEIGDYILVHLETEGTYLFTAKITNKIYEENTYRDFLYHIQILHNFGYIYHLGAFHETSFMGKHSIKITEKMEDVIELLYSQKRGNIGHAQKRI